MISHRHLLAFVLSSLPLASLPGQQIATRAALVQQLGTVQSFDDFETFVWPFSGAMVVGSTLDQNTVVGAFGPGLVAGGVRYVGVSGNLLFEAPSGSNLSSNGLTTPGASLGQLVIEYAAPVPAAGFDLLFEDQVFGPLTAQVQFRDPAGATVGTVSVTQSGPLQPGFVGWGHAGGIGSVVVSSGNLFSPAVIDDHLFGLDPSLGATSDVVGSGCGERFMSIYEEHASFDLSNTSLTFQPNGANYTVVPGVDPVVPPTAAPLPSVGTNQALQLGWVFPYPGGSTQTLYVSPLGFVRFVSGSAGLLDWIYKGPVIGARVDTYSVNLGPTSDVTFETDPVARTATITFTDVSVFGQPGQSTFQFAFDGAGRVDVRYGACDTGPAKTGWSPVDTAVIPPSFDISAAGTLVLPPSDEADLEIRVASDAVIGATADLVVDQIPAGALAVLHAFGLTALAAPIDLVVVGMPGCFAYVPVDFSVATLSPGASANYGLALPNQLALVGMDLYAQGFALDPAGAHNAFGGLTSNALRLGIGLY